MVIHACNLRRLRQADHEFQASLGYTRKLCLKTKQINNNNKRGQYQAWHTAGRCPVMAVLGIWLAHSLARNGWSPLSIPLLGDSDGVREAVERLRMKVGVGEAPSATAAGHRE